MFSVIIYIQFNIERKIYFKIVNVNLKNAFIYLYFIYLRTDLLIYLFIFETAAHFQL